MATTKLAVDIGIEITVMALRERIMDYFKGNCVESFVTCHEISMFNLSEQISSNYYYARREARNQQKTLLLLAGVPLLTLQHYPEQATFHIKVLRRSPELRQVEQELRQFFKQYLSGVEIVDNAKGVNYAD